MLNPIGSFDPIGIGSDSHGAVMTGCATDQETGGRKPRPLGGRGGRGRGPGATVFVALRYVTQSSELLLRRQALRSQKNARVRIPLYADERRCWEMTMIGSISDMWDRFRRALWRMFGMRGMPRRPNGWEDPGTTRLRSPPRLTAPAEQMEEETVLPKPGPSCRSRGDCRDPQR
jgi:hypothetical protein